MTVFHISPYIFCMNIIIELKKYTFVKYPQHFSQQLCELRDKLKFKLLVNIHLYYRLLYDRCIEKLKTYFVSMKIKSD